MPMGEAFASPLAFRDAALAASSFSTTPPDSSSTTMCRGAVAWPRPAAGLAIRKASQQLVQPEAFFQLPAIVLLEQRHELALPDPAQPGRGLGGLLHEVGRPDHEVAVPLVDRIVK